MKMTNLGLPYYADSFLASTEFYIKTTLDICGTLKRVTNVDCQMRLLMFVSPLKIVFVFKDSKMHCKIKTHSKIKFGNGL